MNHIIQGTPLNFRQYKKYKVMKISAVVDDFEWQKTFALVDYNLTVKNKDAIGYKIAGMDVSKENLPVGKNTWHLSSSTIAPPSEELMYFYNHMALNNDEVLSTIDPKWMNNTKCRVKRFGRKNKLVLEFIPRQQDCADSHVVEPRGAGSVLRFADWGKSCKNVRTDLMFCIQNDETFNKESNVVEVLRGSYRVKYSITFKFFGSYPQLHA